MSDAHWTTVTTADNESLAHLDASRLRDADIPVMLVPGDAASYMGASSPYVIKVPADRVADAKELLL